MMNEPFLIETIRPIREGMTISRDSKLGKQNKVTFFSLGSDTSISQESYDHLALYVAGFGEGNLIVGKEKKVLPLGKGNIALIPSSTLCGIESKAGFVYTEVIFLEEEKSICMNKNIKASEVFALKDLINYEEGSIANMDVVVANNMKYVLMAFDEGTGLSPHRAPGNAIVFALEGKATIGYEGKDYELKEGECFRFDKGGLHSVSAKGRFKMALLLVIE